MDKILFSALFAFLAAIVTGVISLVKLISDKEGKISEQRQDWNNSARQCLSDIVSRGTLLLELMEDCDDKVKTLNELTAQLEGAHQDKKPHLERLLNYQKGILENNLNEMLLEKRNFYSAYNLARLHFKPNDPIFSLVEEKAKSFINSYNQLVNKKNQITPEIKIQLHQWLEEIIGYSKKILKEEWETIKRGEPRFIKSLNYSIKGIYVSFFIIILGFALAFYKKDVLEISLKENLEQSKFQHNFSCDKNPTSNINNTYLTLPDRLDCPITKSEPSPAQAK